jgi:REP-associated tyrosine transposase
MPRSNRIDIANGLHHVTQRGLDRTNIVRDDDDRSHWWRLFDRIAIRFRWRIFAVALLDNHFHIYLRTPDPNLSDGMRDLDGGYASLFNQRHKREGPLYQGRFKSVLVENDSHSWELSRYVHLNPYRACLTRDPFEYRWSSYRFYLDSRRAPEWLDWKTILAEFAGTEGAARVAYKRFVESGMASPPPNPVKPAEETGILGSPQFIRECQQWLTPCRPTKPTLDDIIQAVCTEFRTTRETLAVRGQHHHTARDMAILLSRELLAEPLETIAATFGRVSRSGISEIVKRARKREQSDAMIARQLEAIRDKWRQ